MKSRVDRRLKGAWISPPPGVVLQQGCRSRTICDLTFSGVNGETVDLSHPKAMQFGAAFHRLLCVAADEVKKYSTVLPSARGRSH